jgi:LPXTG-motif cell wall-anchored protein
MKKKFLGIAVAVALLSTTNSFASKFANQFIEFELPPQWQCNLEGAEWVCQSSDASKKKDAIIVLAAKLKGDQDSLDQYLTYLKAAKSWTSVQGRAVKSDPKYAKTENINGDAWVDALHLESEIPGFYTRYLATVKQDIGVLVTYSINKAKYQQYLGDFENMVKTLKVFRKPGLNAAPANSDAFRNIQMPNNVSNDAIFPNANVQGGADSLPQTPKQQGIPMALILVIAAAVGYIIWRKRQNRGGDN